MKVIDIYSKNILLEKKIYKNNLIYDVSNKTFMGSKTLRIWFDKIDGFIKIYGGIYEKSEKSGITDSTHHKNQN